MNDIHNPYQRNGKISKSNEIKLAKDLKNFDEIFVYNRYGKLIDSHRPSNYIEIHDVQKEMMTLL